MTLDDFKDLFDSPYLDEVMPVIVRQVAHEDSLKTILGDIPAGSTPEETFDALKAKYEDGSLHMDQITILEMLRLLVASGADRQLNGLWDEKNITLFRYLLNNGTDGTPLRNTSAYKGADYAKLLRLGKGGDRGIGMASQCPAIAWSNGSCLDLDSKPATNYFYPLPKSSKLTSEISAYHIYKCKEHPDLLFIKWKGNHVTMNNDDDFFSFVEQKLGREKRSAIEWTVLEETKEDDFEEYNG